MPSNEQPYPVQLRVCNEKAPAGCTLSGQQNVQSYGRLEGMLNDIGAPTVNGKDVTWTVTGSSNGDAGMLVYSINGGAAQTIALSGVGAFSQSITGSTADFAQNIRLEVWLRDNAPAGRGESYKRNDARERCARARGQRAQDPEPRRRLQRRRRRGAATTASPTATTTCPCATPTCAPGSSSRSTASTRASSCRLSGTGIDDSAWAVQLGIDLRRDGDVHPAQLVRQGQATVTCTGTGAFGKQSSGFGTW